MTARPPSPPVLPLFVWLSPGFPVGAFAYSHGLEWAIEEGTIPNAAGLEGWLADLVAAGSIRADAILLAAAWQAATCLDMALVCEVNDFALALAPTRERLLETAMQGNAFLTAILPAWPAPTLTLFVQALADRDAAYPVAVGVAAAAHGITLQGTLEVFALATSTNLVSAAVRLGAIGQSEAQATIAALCPAASALARAAAVSTLADCGTLGWGADIASMRHETQYSRLFRS